MSEEKPKKSFAKKIVSTICIVVIALIVILALVAANLGNIVKGSINHVVPQITKCEAHVDDVNFSLLKGEFEIKNLNIKNPEGFKSDHAFALGRIAIKVNVGSLLSDTIQIPYVIVEAPQITYELALGKTNLGTILDNVNSTFPSGDEKKEEGKEEEPKKEGGKKVIIDLVKVTDGKVGIAATIAGGAEAPIPLPDIELKDLGKEKGGVSIGEAIAETMKKTLNSVFDALKSAGKMLTDSAKAIGDAAGDAVKSAGEKAKSAVEGIKSLIPGKK